MYRQFALTVAISVVISGFTALTLTPALCAILLKSAEHDVKLFRPFNRAFDWITQRFLGTVDMALRRRLGSLLVFLAIIGVGVVLFLRLPGSFVPPEDQGYLFGSVQLPDGATLERTGKTTQLLQKMIRENPAVENVLVINGFDLIGGGNKTNSATMFMPLKPWEEREQTAQQVAAEVIRKASTLKDGIAFAFNPPTIRGIGQAGGFEVYLQGRSDPDPRRLAQVSAEFMSALAKHPALTGINSFYRPTTPQLKVDVDREKAISLGVPVSDVFDALQATMGTLYVNDFNKFGRTYRVQLQADAAYRAKPEDLGNIYVRSGTSGEMIPLKALIQTRYITGPEQLERYNGFVAAKILGAGKPGISSGDAIHAVEDVAAKVLPEGYTIAWTGQAFQEKRTGSASVYAFAFALVMVFLILAALYERWLVPTAVLLAVPFAVVGALAFVSLRGLENDIYFQIGLVVLIGLAAKNAILIVEFAQQGYLDGLSAIDAAVQAARLRFRPIIMTSLAFVLGVVPLVLSSGAGAAARRSMGSGVFGGMLAATFIATLFVPLFFVWTARSRKKPGDHPSAPAPAAVQGESS
jgi:hydrophobe/amphiphile efflux-1 (HAE1) family protein